MNNKFLLYLLLAGAGLYFWAKTKTGTSTATKSGVANSGTATTTPQSLQQAKRQAASPASTNIYNSTSTGKSGTTSSSSSAVPWSQIIQTGGSLLSTTLPALFKSTPSTSVYSYDATANDAKVNEALNSDNWQTWDTGTTRDFSVGGDIAVVDTVAEPLTDVSPDYSDVDLSNWDEVSQPWD